MMKVALLFYITSHTVLLYGANQEVNPLEFVEQFEDAFSKYIFGYNHCYYYTLDNGVTDHCSLNTKDDDDDYSILKTSKWKRLLLNNAKNTHCYIATLYICPTRSTDEVKPYALQHIQIPSQTCIETNIVRGKNEGKGIGIQLFKSMECETEMEEETAQTAPFVFCTEITDAGVLVQTAEFCFNINGEQRCFNDFKIPDICEEDMYHHVASTQSTANPDSDRSFITSDKTRWFIGILSVIGLCVFSMFVVLCGWKHCMCQSVAEDEYSPWQRKPCTPRNDDDDRSEHNHNGYDAFDLEFEFDETIEYDDGRELAMVQQPEFESEEQDWHHMLDI